MKYFIVEYSMVGYKDDGHDLHAYTVDSLESMARVVTEAKQKGLNIVERKQLENECSLHFWSANGQGCLVVVPLGDTE